MSENTTGTDSRLGLSCSPHFLQWLQESQLSLAVTSYQTNRLFLIGRSHGGGLSVFERRFDHATGLYATPQRLFVASRYQIWQLQNLLAPGSQHNGYDRLFVPRIGHTCGEIDLHDCVVDKEGRVFFINTLYSCLCTLSDQYNFKPVWQPPFISDLLPQDRCHLNGLAMAQGKPRYVTCFSHSDDAAGWRRAGATQGCLVDISTNEIIIANLSMPHSPRFYGGRLWLLNSGSGELGTVDLQSGRFDPVIAFPGYLRGLAFHGDYAIVALSTPRPGLNDNLVLKQRIPDDGKPPLCGIWVVDLRNLEHKHWLQFHGVVQELYDVQILPNVKRPMALGFKSDEIRNIIGFQTQGAAHLHQLSSMKRSTRKDDAKIPADKPPHPTPSYAYETNQNIPVSEVLDNLLAITFPNLRKQADTRSIQSPLGGTVALYEGQAIGLALMEHTTGSDKASVISWFVIPEHRCRGVGTQLLNCIERMAKNMGCQQLDMQFRGDWTNKPDIIGILKKSAWSKPSASMMLYQGTMKDIAFADWLDHDHVPEDFEIFPWSELTAHERALLLERQNNDPWYPPELTPFQEEQRIEFLNSVGLRHQGEVVGWMITHRTAPDTIQYTTLFVRKDLQRQSRAIPLLATAIKRQMSSDVARGICQVQPDTPRMIRYMQRRFLPFAIAESELYYARKVFETNRSVRKNRQPLPHHHDQYERA